MGGASVTAHLINYEIGVFPGEYCRGPKDAVIEKSVASADLPKTLFF